MVDILPEKYYPNRKISFDPSLLLRCQHGIFLGIKDGDVASFKGIPYAKQPIGELRWKKAEKAESCSDIFEAFSFGKSCMQPIEESEPASMYQQGEDCLTLNIWKSTLEQSLHKAIMVFFHGGNFVGGGTVDPLYNGSKFVHNNPDIIFITVNYRIGILGFFDSSPLKGNEGYHESINLSFWDMITALQWIKDNAAAFNGDPNRVTIFGHSSGASMVSLLATLPQAKGLFRRIIAQSGSASFCQEKILAENRTKKIKKMLGADSMEELTALSHEKLQNFWDENAVLFSNVPTKGVAPLSKDPLKDWEEGIAKDYDVMQGFCSDEWRYFVMEFGNSREFFDLFNIESLEVLLEASTPKFLQDCAVYIRELEKKYGDWGVSAFMTDKIFVIGLLYQAYYQAKNGGKSFVYQFDYPVKEKQFGACHCAELHFIFENFENDTYEGTDEEINLSRIMQRMWANFAQTGNPSTEDFTWEEYNCDKRNVMVLGQNIHIETDPEKERREKILQLARESEIFKYSPSSSQIFERILEKFPGINEFFL